jgi:peptidoglycan/LPS O-acetylase OafA/YrhL
MGIPLPERKILYKGFSDNLLSVRGIAAMMVLIFHGMLIFQVSGVNMQIHQHLRLSHPQQFLNELIIFLTNGSAAVTFFFVHSGFVLALSLTDKPGFQHWLTKGISVFAFYIKRLLRFYPMIILTVGAAYCYQKWFFKELSDPVVSVWFRKFFMVSPHLRQNILLQKFNLNPFLWSLRIELIGSLLMPLFYFAARRIFTTYLLFFAFYLYANNFLPHHTTKVTFVMCFFLGTLLGTVHAELKDTWHLLQSGFVDNLSAPWKRRVSSWLTNPNLYLLFAALVLLFARPYAPTIASAAVIESLASTVIVFIIYYVDDGPLQRFCRLPVIKFLGEISYSLYILSFLIIHLVGSWMYSVLDPVFISKYGLLANLLTTLVIAIVTIGVSTVTYYVVERPFMQLGRWIYACFQTYLRSPQFENLLGNLSRNAISQPTRIDTLQASETP